MKKKLTALVLALMLLAGATAALAQEAPEVPAQDTPARQADGQEAPETTVKGMTNAALSQRIDDMELLLSDIAAILEGDLYPAGTQTFPYAYEAQGEVYQDEAYTDEIYTDEAYLDEAYSEGECPEETCPDSMDPYACGVPYEGQDAATAIEDRLQGLDMMIMDMRAFLGMPEENAPDMGWDEYTWENDLNWPDENGWNEGIWDDDLQWSDETGWSEDPAGDDTAWMDAIPEDASAGDMDGADSGMAYDAQASSSYAEDGTDVTLADLMARIEALEARLQDAAR